MKPIKQRVLIVDDNDEIRNILSEFLARKGFEVGIAGNGLEALKIFIDKGFDLVLTDFQMPFVDGLTLARKIKERQPKTLIIMMTSGGRIKLHENRSVDHILDKPLKLNDLCTFLQCAVESIAQDCSLQVDYSA